MSYIFMDESGDLGFDFKKKKTSKVFVITCLFIENKGQLKKIVKKPLAKGDKDEDYENGGETDTEEEDKDDSKK